MDAWICITIALLSVGFLVEANKYDIQAARYPKYLLYIIFVLCIAVFAESFIKGKPGQRDRTIWRERYIPALTVFLMIALYAAGVWFAGMLIPTVIFLAVAMRYFGEKRWGVIIGVTAVFCAVLYAVFVIFLGVPIPMLPAHV